MAAAEKPGVSPAEINEVTLVRRLRGDARRSLSVNLTEGSR